MSDPKVHFRNGRAVMVDDDGKMIAEWDMGEAEREEEEMHAEIDRLEAAGEKVDVPKFIRDWHRREKANGEG